MSEEVTLGGRLDNEDGGSIARTDSDSGAGHAAIDGANFDLNGSVSTTSTMEQLDPAHVISSSAKLEDHSTSCSTTTDTKQQDSESGEPKLDEAAQDAPLSKKAQKKLARAARHQEVKLERRAREKERKKERKRLAKEETEKKREAGEDVSADEQPRKRAKTVHEKPFGARIVVDLGFDDMMSDKVSSLLNQNMLTQGVIPIFRRSLP